MKRVVIFGPGGPGKSTLAVRLGEITGLPVIELDMFPPRSFMLEAYHRSRMITSFIIRYLSWQAHDGFWGRWADRPVLVRVKRPL
jgi:adenylate kinase family enzyme